MPNIKLINTYRLNRNENKIETSQIELHNENFNLCLWLMYKEVQQKDFPLKNKIID